MLFVRGRCCGARWARMVQLATHSEATHELNEPLWAVEREAFLLREQNYASAVSIVSNAAQKVCEP